VPSSAANARTRRVLVGVGILALLLALALGVWRGSGAQPPPAPAESPQRASSLPSTPPPAPPPAPPPPPARPSPEALATALGEEWEPQASGVRIEAIDLERPWVCAGEVMGLSARFGGVSGSGVVSRWLWPVTSGRVELQPGPALRWRAPPVAGRYPVRFQVCTDLGGRRIGILAERRLELEVRACGEGERPAHEPLHLAVLQRGPGRFAFEARYEGAERVSAYAWDFGDGVRETTTEPHSEHTYALATQEPRSFTVRLEAHLVRGPLLTATAFALTRGSPSQEPPAVDLRVSHWRPEAEGNGWRSDLEVRVPEDTEVVWERVERVLLRWDGEADTDTKPWRERIHVDEELERGGFRGHVTVSAAEAAPELKQVLDFLHGHDATGQDVEVSWSPFKREAPPEPATPSPPPVKE
jgi:hypothetical protein